MRRAAIGLLSMIAVLLLTPAAAAQTDDHEHEELIVLSGDVRVDADQSFHDIVVFHGDLTMEGEVHETLVVFHGDLIASGHVAGDVVVFEGDVTIASGAEVNGDIASLRDPVIEEGATVDGELRRPTKDFFSPVEIFAARVALWIAATVSFLILGLLMIALAPRPMDSMAATWATSKGSAALWGVILLIGIPIGAVLIMLTVVGIPFGLGALFALWLVYSIAYVSAAWALGRSIVKEPASRYLAFLAGLGILRLLGLIPVAGGIISTITTVFGLGLIAVTMWRAKKAATPTTPAPPAPA